MVTSIKGAFVSVDHPTAGVLSFAGSPIRFTSVTGGEGGFDEKEGQAAAAEAAEPEAERIGGEGGTDFSKPAPTLGQHTRSILQNDLGLSIDEINELQQRGVVGC